MHKFPKHGEHLIGLAGYAGSGKDTVADILVRCGSNGFPARRLALADPLREMVSLFRGPIERLRVEQPHLYRQDMQALGAYCRANFGSHFWIDALAKRYRAVRGRVPGVVVVISDVRYTNELEWIREQGGQLWWVQRDTTKQLNNHESELAYDTLRNQADTILPNNGTLEDLEAAIRYRVERSAG